MSAVFGDTFYSLALINRRDDAHSAALRWSQKVSTEIVTTECILTEVGDALAHPNHRKKAARFIELLRQNPKIRIVAMSSGLFARAFQRYGERVDKDWSLTDCSSFVVMRDYKLTDALTADHNFEQAGFTALLMEDTTSKSTT